MIDRSIRVDGHQLPGPARVIVAAATVHHQLLAAA